MTTTGNYSGRGQPQDGARGPRWGGRQLPLAIIPSVSKHSMGCHSKQLLGFDWCVMSLSKHSISIYRCMRSVITEDIRMILDLSEVFGFLDFIVNLLTLILITHLHTNSSCSGITSLSVLNSLSKLRIFGQESPKHAPSPFLSSTMFTVISFSSLIDLLFRFWKEKTVIHWRDVSDEFYLWQQCQWQWVSLGL